MIRDFDYQPNNNNKNDKANNPAISVSHAPSVIQSVHHGNNYLMDEITNLDFQLRSLAYAEFRKQYPLVLDSQLLPWMLQDQQQPPLLHHQKFPE